MAANNIASKNDSYNVIISIKPAYADMILDGKKRYEFRKHGFRKQIDKVFIYSTKPISKIMGYFTFDEILKGTPPEIWEICSEYAGILEDDFYKYYERAKIAFAIKINSVFRIEEPISPFKIKGGFSSPRSFTYTNDKFSNLIGHRL
jgi:predicted transcriptional regulator